MPTATISTDSEQEEVSPSTADSVLLAALSSTSASTSASIANALACLVARVNAPTAGEEPLGVEAFLQRAEVGGHALLDVRSPAEFEKGHIPGAHNLPLFSNEERAVVGTTYKQQSREAAMLKGMGCVGPRLQALVTRARVLSGGEASLGQCRVAVYCWRGGMRSGAVGWLLRQHGVDVCRLSGGYKAFRGWALSTWGDVAMPVPKAQQRKPKPSPSSNNETAQGRAKAQITDGTPAVVSGSVVAEGRGGLPASLVEAARAVPGRRVCVIGGRTGVGKTRVLHALRQMGEAVIDLEGLAGHRGSVFGWVGQRWEGKNVSEPPEQPRTEHFVNLLAMAWRDVNRRGAVGNGSESGAFNERGWLFIEDEDSHIGGCTLPASLYAVLRCAPLVVRVVVGEAARLQLLVEDYTGEAAKGGNESAWLERMEASVMRLKKRLGGAAVTELQRQLRAGEYAAVGKVLIAYYDKLYDKHTLNSSGYGTSSRPGVVLEALHPEALPRLDASLLARGVLHAVDTFEARERREADQGVGSKF